MRRHRRGGRMQYLQAVPRSFLPMFAAAILVAAACGENPEAVPGGAGGDTGSGTGGSGGSTHTTCSEDCGARPTGACEISVCNDGSYPGEVGQCVTIP